MQDSQRTVLAAIAVTTVTAVKQVEHKQPEGKWGEMCDQLMDSHRTAGPSWERFLTAVLWNTSLPHAAGRLRAEAATTELSEVSKVGETLSTQSE